MSDRLFVPLNKEWYNLFLAGKKKWEIRGYSSRFNEKTVKVGRSVELRKGYMKEGAIWGKIVEVHIVSTVYIPIINIMDELFPIPANSPLWLLPQVIISPHISGASPHYNERAAALFSENLYRYVGGLPLYNLFDPQRGY
mgnify:CR=1 FL=1